MTTSLSEDSFKEEIQRQCAVLLLKFIHGDSSSMTPISAILSSSSCASSSSPSMPSIFCFKPLLSDFTEYTQTVTVGSASVTTMLSFSATPSTVSCCAAPAGAVPCSLVSLYFCRRRTCAQNSCHHKTSCHYHKFLHNVPPCILLAAVASRFSQPFLSFTPVSIQCRLHPFFLPLPILTLNH